MMQRMYAALPPDAELGVVAQKETLLLQAHGELTNFGHRRSDAEQERYDAALWLAAAPRCFLLIRSEARDPCFEDAAAQSMGFAHSVQWELVPHSAAAPDCVARGRPGTAIAYRAPDKPALTVATAPHTTR
jgi:hypothetical protein